MSVALNDSDFQCLQDQLVDLKTKNYELAEKNRRCQADFEAAKAKICSLQLKLEEQERDFQVTSTTLRREIESVASGCLDGTKSDVVKDDNDYKAKYKKLLHKAKELQNRYERSVEIVQQLDSQNKNLNEKLRKIEEESSKLRDELGEKLKQLSQNEKDYEDRISRAIESHKLLIDGEREKYTADLIEITSERDFLKNEIERLTTEVTNFDNRIESEAEERKIQERKGLQIVKELKRQLALEKSRAETLQKRLEDLLSKPPVSSTPTHSTTDLESRGQLSTASSSTNGHSISSNGNGARANQDANSIGSWSFVPVKTEQSSSNAALNESLSICSIDSEDRETVQQMCDTNSDTNYTQQVDGSMDSSSKLSPSASVTTSSLVKQVFGDGGALNPIQTQQLGNRLQRLNITPSQSSSHNNSDNMLFEDQAALVERLTKLQHDKWMLEEKLSYMEQANSSLSEDLANKSDIIKHYFMDQAMKSANSNHSDPTSQGNNLNNSRRLSFPSQVNHLLNEKPSFKKVVDFLKERSQISTTETESISREATKKMQLMLEETLIKCLKLQENLDFVTSELNKLRN